MSLAAVLEQLRGVVAAYPDEEVFRRGHPREWAATLRRTSDWDWWAQDDRMVGALVFPALGIDLAVCWASAERVRRAREFVPVLARVLPRDLVVRIHAEVFWGGAPGAAGFCARPRRL